MTPPRRRSLGACGRSCYIRLRYEQFELMARVLGYTSDNARARLIGTSAKSIYRARKGQLGIDVVAHILASLIDRRDELATYNLTPTFDALFEVVRYESDEFDDEQQR